MHGGTRIATSPVNLRAPPRITRERPPDEHGTSPVNAQALSRRAKDPPDQALALQTFVTIIPVSLIGSRERAWGRHVTPADDGWASAVAAGIVQRHECKSCSIAWLLFKCCNLRRDSPRTKARHTTPIVIADRWRLAIGSDGTTAQTIVWAAPHSELTQKQTRRTLLPLIQVGPGRGRDSPRTPSAAGRFRPAERR